jgi:MFS family permease
MVLYSRSLIFIGILLRALATNPTHLLIAAFIGGFSGGGFFPVLVSMVCDIVTRDDQQEAISTLFFFSSIGLVIGPVLGSALLMWPGVTLRTLYQIVAISQIGVLLYLSTQIRETKAPVSSRTLLNRDAIVPLLSAPMFQGLLATAFLYFFSRSILNTYLPIYARLDLALSNPEVASLATFRSLGIILIRFSSATFLTRIAQRPIFLLAIALGGVVSFLSPLANTYLSLLFVIFLSLLSYTAISILGNVFVARTATAQNRGVATSLYNVASSTGNITKIATTPLAESGGLVPVFIIGGITAFLALLPSLIRRARAS